MALIVSVAGCALPQAIDVSLQPHEDSAQLELLVKHIHQKVNEHRVSQNLAELKLDSRISRVARRHSAAMAQGVMSFNHHGFQSRARTIRKFLAYRAVAENLAYNRGGAAPASTAMGSWLRSNSHRDAIEGRYQLTGIGIAKSKEGRYYFTQMFVLPLR